MTLPPDPLADGLAAYARRLRDGTTTIEACVRQTLARIVALNDILLAFLHVADEEALQCARALDRQLAAGHDAGPLMGVPVGVKDIIAVRDMPLTLGSSLPAEDWNLHEGSFISRLRAAGCILLGKLATSEFALGGAGVNYNLGTPRNPWDATQLRVPGGSSSGSAVAVAAGLCGFSVGTDTGGSVRTPAAFCGVVGLKPSPDTWPLDGILPFSPTLDTLGIMARSAQDTALIYETLSAGALRIPCVAPETLRLGYARSLFEGLSPEVGAALGQALSRLRQAGTIVSELEAPALARCQTLFPIISGFELVSSHGQSRLKAGSPRFNPDVTQRMAQSLAIDARAYQQAMAQREPLYQQVQPSFQQVDAVLAPTKWRTAPVFSPEYDLERDEAMTMHCAGPTRAANVLGLCALSLPVPVDTAGLPVGLQLIGDRHADDKLLSVALALETLWGPPPVPALEPFLTSTRI